MNVRQVLSRLPVLSALALLLSTPADASIPSSPAIARAEVARVVPLSPSSDQELPALFAGVTLDPQAASSLAAEPSRLFAEVSLLPLDPRPLSLPDFPKTRIRPSEFFGQPLTGSLLELTDAEQPGYRLFSRGLVSGGQKDPLGLLCERGNASGFFNWVARCAQDIGTVAGEFERGVRDPRNAAKNVQRAAGGAVGAAKFVGGAAVGLSLLAVDYATMSFDDAAAERMVERGQAIGGFLADPVGAVGRAHSQAFDQILEHEQRGEYFSSGMESGELGVGDASAVAGAGAGARLLGRLGRVGLGRLGGFAFGDLTGAAGQGLSESLAGRSVPGPRFTFRGDYRSPAEIFRTGFQPRGPNVDLFAYVERNVPSVYVGTSISTAEAAEFARGGYLYTTRPIGGVDVNRALGARSPFPYEAEIAVPGGISTENIFGARRIGPDRRLMGPFMRNPGFRP